jgi:hypothetical protein
MDANEEYVRQRWIDVALWDRDFSPYTVNLRYEVEIVSHPGNFFCFHGAKHSEAWSAARAFTEAREEEIRQVEEEIALLNLEFWEMHGEIRLATMVEQYTPLVRELCRWARILAREQAALAELKRGMK